MRRLTALATLAIFGLAACSSDSSPSATTATESAPATTTEPSTDDSAVETTVFDAESAVTTIVDDTAPDDTAPNDSTQTGTGPGTGTEFCDINQELSDNSIALDGTETPAEIEEYFTVVFPEALARLVDTVPAELSEDVDLLVEVSLAFAAVFEANDWDVEATFNDPALEAVFTDIDFEAAGDRVDAYCGV